MLKFTLREKIFFLCFLFLTILIYLIIALTSNQKQIYKSKAEEIPVISPTPEASPSAILASEIETENKEILQTLNKYNSQPQDEPTKQELITKVKERNKRIREGLDISPYIIYQKAFDNDTLSKFPEETKPYLEQRLDKSITGLVNTYIADDFENNKSYTYSTITDEVDNQEYNFYPTSEQTSFISYLSSTKVSLNNGLVIKNSEEEQVKGETADNKPQIVAVKTIDNLIAVNIEKVEAPELDTLGEQKILVFLVKTPEITDNMLPNSQKIKDRINGPINDFFKKNSYGKFSITADVIKKWNTIERNEILNIRNIFYKSFMEELLIQDYQDNINIKQYNHFTLIIVSTIENVIGGFAGLGIRTDSLIFTKLGEIEDFKKNSKRFPFFIVNITGLDLKSYENTIEYPVHTTNEGSMSEFDHLFSHELGHNLGAQHAGFININIPDGVIKQKNTLYSYPIITKDNNYMNPYDTMGYIVSDGLYFNAYIKKYFNWVKEEEGQILRLPVDNFDGDYTIQQLGNKGLTALWLPFATEKKNENLRDYFLEARYNTFLKREAAIINIEESPTYRLLEPPLLEKSFLLNKTVGFEVFTNYVDKINNFKIKLKDQKPNENITISIEKCNDLSLNLASYSGGSDSTNFKNITISSLNIFENDLQKNKGSINFSAGFLIENDSNCFDKFYKIISNEINIGNLKLSNTNFFERADFVPSSYFKPNSLTATIQLNKQTPDSSFISFEVKGINEETKEPLKEEGLLGVFYFHLVPSPEEYKTDLEPHRIDAVDKDEYYFDNFIFKKRQKILFKSAVSNNSRNTDYTIKSPVFPVVWKITDKDGKNVISEVSGRHEGIPPMTKLFESKVSEFLWTIPDSLSEGEYKVSYEVDDKNSINEFNENNNYIEREFIIAE